MLALRVAALSALCCALLGCAPPITTAPPCVLNTECPEPLACVDGRCGSECSLNQDCIGGAYCVYVAEGVGRCFVSTVNQCDVATDCPYTGLECVDRRCYNRCEAGCPMDSSCVSGRCLPIAPDGGPRDAGPVPLSERRPCDTRTGAPCVAGERCGTSYGGTPVCRTTCTAHADCPAPDLCGRVSDGSSEQQCTLLCEPITNAGCLAGDTCDPLIFQFDADYVTTWECRAAGTGLNGEVCDPAAPMRCAAGLTCSAETGRDVCRPICELGGAACPLGLTCATFTQVPRLAGRSFGTCVPNR